MGRMSQSRDAGSPRGQVLVMAAVGFTVFLGVAAMAVDYGGFLVTQRYLQNAADGAALAGAAGLGDPDAPLGGAQVQAAEHAVEYLDINLDLNLSAGERTAVVGSLNMANGYCYPNPADCANARYQFWIYTPTPSATATASVGLPNGNRTVYLEPRKYPSRARTIFVRVDRPGNLFFGRIFADTPPVIATQAIAGPSGKRCAVGALKPRLGSPDNSLGITLNSAKVFVGRGDVCSNYSISWAGAGAEVIFTGTTEQTVFLAEPGAMQGSESVTGGTVDVLDELLEDPKYSRSMAGVDVPPATALPECMSSADKLVARVTCSASTFPTPLTLYPGKYQLIDVPNGKEVTLSASCHPDDGTCVPGVYWFQVPSCSGSTKGGLWVSGTSAPGSTVQGQGVLLVFDPFESGPGCMDFDVTGTNARLRLNNDPNMQSTLNPGGTIPFVWYNPTEDDQYADPVSVWVRPNYVTGTNTYNMTNVTHNGSSVIKFSSNPDVQENGVIYAPEDNTEIAGNGTSNGVGQVITWTITYSGAGTSLAQNFAGGHAERPRLLQ